MTSGHWGFSMKVVKLGQMLYEFFSKQILSDIPGMYPFLLKHLDESWSSGSFAISFPIRGQELTLNIVGTLVAGLLGGPEVTNKSYDLVSNIISLHNSVKCWVLSCCFVTNCKTRTEGVKLKFWRRKGSENTVFSLFFLFFFLKKILFYRGFFCLSLTQGSCKQRALIILSIKDV